MKLCAKMAYKENVILMLKLDPLILQCLVGEGGGFLFPEMEKQDCTNVRSFASHFASLHS